MLRKHAQIRTGALQMSGCDPPHPHLLQPNDQHDLGSVNTKAGVNSASGLPIIQAIKACQQ